MHFRLRHCEAPQGAVAIRVPCIADLRQICGFAGLFIVLSFISGTPLSSLVRRKLQRSTRRRGEENLPALRSTPLRAESFLFRWSPAAQDADLPALLLQCFQLEIRVLSPMKRDDSVLYTSGEAGYLHCLLSTVHCPLKKHRFRGAFFLISSGRSRASSRPGPG